MEKNMLGLFVKEGMSEVEIENPVLNVLAKVVLPEVVDVVEIATVSTATYFGWTAAVNAAADKKIKKAEEEKKAAEEKKEEPEAEVVDSKTGKAAK